MLQPVCFLQAEGELHLAWLDFWSAKSVRVGVTAHVCASAL